MSVTVYQAREGNRPLSDHFFVRDFACRDGSAEVPVEEELVAVLEDLYGKLDCGCIRICAGYRSAAYARRMRRTKDYGHMQGKAADIVCFDRQKTVISATRVLQAIDEIGHRGGAAYVSPSMVHVDTREERIRYDETRGGCRAAAVK